MKAPVGPQALIKAAGPRHYCPVPLPWFRFLRADTPAAALRRAAYRARGRRGLKHRIRQAWYGLAWPTVMAPRAAAWAVRQWGAELEAHAGIGRWRQFREILVLAVTDNVPPNVYYLFRLWEPARRPLAGHYIQEYESQPLFRSLNRSPVIAELRDKERFHAACRREGLPTVPVIAVFGPGGAARWPGEPGPLPRRDLFRKPRDLNCGKGTSAWHYDGTADRWTSDGRTLDEAGLLADCHQVAEELGWHLLQPRVMNHPAVAPLSTGGLCTVRMVTVKPPGQSARHFLATFRMPVAGRIADNFTPGGLAAGVAPDGRLLRGARPFVGAPLDRHPDTGALITGSALPFWREAVDLVTRAHQTFKVDGALGWDVALTADGPMLVEVNPTWGTELMQASHHGPLGDTDLPELLGAVP